MVFISFFLLIWHWFAGLWRITVAKFKRTFQWSMTCSFQWKSVNDISHTLQKEIESRETTAAHKITKLSVSPKGRDSYRNRHFSFSISFYERFLFCALARWECASVIDLPCFVWMLWQMLFFFHSHFQCCCWIWY